MIMDKEQIRTYCVRYGTIVQDTERSILGIPIRETMYYIDGTTVTVKMIGGGIDKIIVD